MQKASPGSVFAPQFGQKPPDAPPAFDVVELFGPDAVPDGPEVLRDDAVLGPDVVFDDPAVLYDDAALCPADEFIAFAASFRCLRTAIQPAHLLPPMPIRTKTAIISRQMPIDISSLIPSRSTR